MMIMSSNSKNKKWNSFLNNKRQMKRSKKFKCSLTRCRKSTKNINKIIENIYNKNKKKQLEI